MTDRTTPGGTGDAGPPQTAFWEESPPTSTPKEGSGADWRTWAAAAAVAVVLLIVGLFVLNRGGDGDDPTVAAGASDEASGASGFPGGGAPGAPGGFGANGEVVSIDGTTLTLRVEVTSGGSAVVSTMTVETDEDTEIVETVEGSLADLAVGDEIVVVGEETDGVIAATTVTEGGQFGGRGAGGQGPPEGFEPPEGAELPDDFEAPEGFEPGQRGPGQACGLASGAITSVDGSTLAVETDNGEVIVEVDDDSMVLITEERSLVDIEIGDSILATGETQDSVVAATRIQIGSLGFGGGGPGGGFSPVPDDDSTTD